MEFVDDLQPESVTDAPGRNGAGAGLCLRLRNLLAQPVDGGSLAWIRIALGLVMILEAWSLVKPSQISGGQIPLEVYYTGRGVGAHFPYAIFAGMPVLSETWLRFLPTVLALAGGLVAIGFLYKVSVILLFLVWGYLFALESTRTYWQCHYYIELLFCFLMIWMPAARRYSLDSWFRRNSGESPQVPFWTVFLLRAQLFITYFYAGAAKINADWLLDAAPVRWYLKKPAVLGPLEGHLSAELLAPIRSVVESIPFAYFICHAGMVFDLLIGGLLLVRRTRALGIGMMMVFHGTNRLLIFDDIDWFPLVGLATALIFLEPDWPARLISWGRKPVWMKPDWKWFWGGLAVLPPVGALLGWRSRQAPQSFSNSRPCSFGVLGFVAAWCLFQGLFPLRHYLIAGDGRLTFEGLSFSWRLKADYYRVQVARMELTDSKLVSRDEQQNTRLNWLDWPGSQVIYHPVVPGRIRWPDLPEIVVVLEPGQGERILYNPFSGVTVSRTEAVSRERVAAIWQELYGRKPDSVRRFLSPSKLEEITRAEQQAGKGQVADRATQNSKSTEALRVLHPFTLDGEPYRPAAFLLIEDSTLQLKTGPVSTSTRTFLWRNSAATKPASRSKLVHVYGDPMVVYLADLGFEERRLLPLFYFEEKPDGSSVSLKWNYLRDLTLSKAMHVSGQPFYLRRYAGIVADRWEEQSGRRPEVRALTAVSFNGRPAQPVVDPNVDLATAPVSVFRHNSWIRDLEVERIPRDALNPPASK